MAISKNIMIQKKNRTRNEKGLMGIENERRHTLNQKRLNLLTQEEKLV